MKTIIERRIEIIQDAIMQLKAKAYNTEGEQTYVRLPNSLKYLTGDAQQSLLNCTETCEVCAKGSLLLSTIRKEDQFDFEQFVSHKLLMQRLTKEELFNEYNLNLIEAYFEDWKFYTYETLSGCVIHSSSYWYQYASGWFGCQKDAENAAEEHNKKRTKFCAKYPVKNKRLLAILKNMVSNEGIFKP